MIKRIKRDAEESGKVIWIPVFVAAAVFIAVFFAARGKFDTPITSPLLITLIAPFQRAAAWAAANVNGAVATVREILDVHDQNKLLRMEVEELRIQNVRANEYAAENIRLRELLGYRESAVQFDLLPAHVIGRESATWTRMMVIDCGTNHGVTKNMPVVTSRGLVGVVTEAAPISSKVELIVDPRSSAGTLVQRSRVAGIVEGNPDDAMHPRMVNIPRNEDVAAGDIVVTSGFGGIYPKGIMVGEVISVHNDSGGLLQYAILEPAVDFQRLEDVAVITASREAPPEPLKTPRQTPGTETDPRAQLAAREAPPISPEGKPAPSQPTPSAASPSGTTPIVPGSPAASSSATPPPSTTTTVSSPPAAAHPVTSPPSAASPIASPPAAPPPVSSPAASPTAASPSATKPQQPMSPSPPATSQPTAAPATQGTSPAAASQKDAGGAVQGGGVR